MCTCRKRSALTLYYPGKVISHTKHGHGASESGNHGERAHVLLVDGNLSGGSNETNTTGNCQCPDGGRDRILRVIAVVLGVLSVVRHDVFLGGGMDCGRDGNRKMAYRVEVECHLLSKQDLARFE